MTTEFLPRSVAGRGVQQLSLENPEEEPPPSGWARTQEHGTIQGRPTWWGQAVSPHLELRLLLLALPAVPVRPGT